MSGPSTFDPFAGYSEFSPLGRNFGNPFANMLGVSLLGHNYMPRPQGNEDMAGAMMQRIRSMNMLGMVEHNFRRQPMVSALGLTNAPGMGLAAHMFGMPDSALTRMLAPLQHGNIPAALVNTYAGAQGMSTMGGLGRVSGFGVQETQKFVETIQNSIAHKQAYDGPGGAREDFKRKGTALFDAYAHRGAEGYQGLKNLGIIDGPLGLDSKGMPTKDVLKQIAAFDITGAGGDKLIAAHEATQSQATELRKQLNSRKDMLTNVNLTGLNAAERDKTLEKLTKSTQEGWDKYVTRLSKDVQEKLKAKGVNLKGANIHDGSAAAELEKLGVPNVATQIALQARAAKKAGYVIDGFDFQKSRGFAVEDLTSAAINGAGLRMFGDSRGKTPEMLAKDFMNHGTGALDAARSLFGKDKSPAELMKSMSELMGNSGMHLGSEGGGKQAEELLRKVQSTARVAGINIKTLLGIIKATQDLYANNPILQGVGGKVITETALNNLSKTNSLAASMDGETYRKEGGDQGINADFARADAQYKQDLGRKHAVIASLAKANGQGAALAEYLKKPGNSLSTLMADPAMVQQLTGRSSFEVNSLAHDEALGAEAIKDDDVASDVEKHKNKELHTQFTQQIANIFQGRDKEKAQYEEAVKNGRTLDAKRIINSIAGSKSQAAGMVNLYGKDIFTEEKKRLDPAYRAQTELNDALIQSDVDVSTKLAKDFAGSNAHIFTQLVDADGRAHGDPRQLRDNVAKLFKYDANLDKGKVEAYQGKAADLLEKLNQAGTFQGGNEVGNVMRNGAFAAFKDAFKERRDLLGAGAVGLHGDKALGDITAQSLHDDIENLHADKSLAGMSAKEVLAHIESLQAEQTENGGKLDPTKAKKLHGLLTLKGLGAFGSDKLTSAVLGGNTAQAYAAALATPVAAQAEEEALKRKNELVEKTITGRDNIMASQLEKEGIAALRLDGLDEGKKQEIAAYFKTGGGGSKALDARLNSDKSFLSDEQRVIFNKSVVGKSLDHIGALSKGATEQEAQAVNAEKQQVEMLKALGEIKDAIDSGPLAGKLDGLITQLSAFV